MTDHDDPTTRTLRALDAAAGEIGPVQRARADATLEQILATDPATGSPLAAPRRPRRRATRLVLAGGAAAAAAVVVVPMVSGGSEAFASWSPTPVELTGAERSAAVDACLVLQADSDVVDLAYDARAEASVLVAEARGGWSYVVLRVAGPAGRQLEATCLVPDDLVEDPRPGRGGFYGSLDRAEETADPVRARDVVRVDTQGAGSVDGEAFVFAAGRAGDGVVGIEVTTPGGLEVVASLVRGRWAVWWPAGDTSVSNPELSGAPTYEVTLRDGTVTDEVRLPR